MADEEKSSVLLIRRARGADPGAVAEALGQLIERYRPHLTRVARGVLRGRPSDEPESAVRQGVQDAIEHWPQCHGETPGEVLGWLRTIVRRLALKRLKRGIAAAPEGVLEQVPAGDPSPGAAATRREEQARVLEAVGRLPETYRRVIELRNFEDRGYDEIAQELGVKAVYARKLWSRAVAQLREELGKP